MKAIFVVLGLILFISANGLEQLSSDVEKQLRSNLENGLQERRRLGLFSWLFGGGKEINVEESVPPDNVDVPPPPAPSEEEPAPSEEEPAPAKVAAVVPVKEKIDKRLKNKRVALLQVHFEGNVGDQMETIPLLERLHSWGVVVDCYLSLWMPPLQRLDPHVKERVAPYVNRIFEDGIGYDSNVQAWNYDLLIVTPGPTVNELGHCIHRPSDASVPYSQRKNISMAWFGVSITGWSQYTYEKGQKHCVKLIATREAVSQKRAQEMLDPSLDVNLLMSGDISFSYKYDPADPVIKNYISLFYSRLQTLRKPDWAHQHSESVIGFESTPVYEGSDWVMIFSRENNFGKGKGIFIADNKVHVKTIENVQLEFDIEKVVFASSSNLEDKNHLKNLRNKHDVHHTRTLVCESVEEMFAMVSSAPHVITDRYHPGVAAMIVGTKLTITSYKLEATKMQGLYAMSKYSHDQIKAMNDKAFAALMELIIKDHRDSSFDPDTDPVYRKKLRKGKIDEDAFADRR